MLVNRNLGSPVYSQTLGMVEAEVYASDVGYQLFLVGEHLASFIGVSTDLSDCIEEIKTLQSLVKSDTFRREVARYC